MLFLLYHTVVRALPITVRSITGNSFNRSRIWSIFFRSALQQQFWHCPSVQCQLVMVLLFILLSFQTKGRSRNFITKKRENKGTIFYFLRSQFLFFIESKAKHFSPGFPHGSMTARQIPYTTGRTGNECIELNKRTGRITL